MPRSLALPTLAAVLALAAFPAAGALAERASVEQLARTADAVVRGKVAAQSSRWAGSRIVTDVQVKTAEVWRGKAPSTVTITVPGGVVGGIGQRVDGVPAFTDGEEVVVFVRQGRGGRWKLQGLRQGKFTVRGDAATPSLDELGFVRSEIRAGERAAEEMSTAELRRRVKEAR